MTPRRGLSVIEVCRGIAFPGQPLHARIDRRVDVKGLRAHRRGAVLIDPVIGDIVEEIRLADVLVESSRLETGSAQRRPSRTARWLMSLLSSHRLQHFVSARGAGGLVVERVVATRRLGQPREAPLAPTSTGWRARKKRSPPRLDARRRSRRRRPGHIGRQMSCFDQA